MSLRSHYILIASMDVDREHEAIFNEVYDKEHIPYLSEVPGVISVARFHPRTYVPGRSVVRGKR